MKHAFRYPMTRITALVLIALFCATGCKDAQSTKSKAMASWIGASTGAVIAAWGEPTKSYPTKEGGHALCYLNDQRFVIFNQLYADQPANVGAYLAPSNDPVYTKADTDEYRFFRVFFTEADGTVNDWAWRGDPDKEVTEGKSEPAEGNSR